ncbi:hypothetical protein CAPTEDRAFT_150820 [Capitella teleta]|uniref:CoA transferase n=1 Tax=Capitella teleta TaxID=283909 RepID=R7TGQ4_CAPTE|nr:hypothetical protein CAPTEDRAFT_150820 [Capitella teleta]|eukprot:ELT92978.1 hypothetical protein CAPTEDRAFT_150820 [Capitella teleta]
MILGDLGAEIIKVERPGIGDDTRAWGPPWVDSESAYYLSVNRNKKSIAVDISTEEGSNIVKELACNSDVLVENYIPNKLSKYGLGFKQLNDIAPHLIYLSITGFGQTGPYSQRGGYDNIAAAVGGLMHITGPIDGEPCRVGVAMTDLSTGLYAYGAILAALLNKQKTGIGQHIDCNLLSTQVATLTHIASNWLNCEAKASRWGTGHGSIVPYQAFKTIDGYIMIGAGNDVLYAELCERLDLPNLIKDERYLTNEDRVKNRKSLVDVLSEKFALKSNAEWLEAFEGSRFPFGPINDIGQVFQDPQVQHNNMIQEIEHQTVGNIRVPGPAVKYSEGSLSLQSSPPFLGQHTREVLEKQLKYDNKIIDELANKGVIQI